MKKVKAIYQKICYKLQRKFDTIVIRAYKYVKRKQDFLHSARAVHVKKGKRKYTLLFIETKDGEYRVNLGRHREITHGHIPVIKL